jgi:tyrosine-protein phosphatase YwqE
MRNAGYKVILAHPERYPYYYEDDLEQYQEIKGQGVFFQLNIASLSGVYGNGAKRMAEKMIDANMIDFISTDLHNTRHLGYINEALKFPYLEKIMNYEGLMNKVLI